MRLCSGIPGHVDWLRQFLCEAILTIDDIAIIDITADIYTCLLYTSLVLGVNAFGIKISRSSQKRSFTVTAIHAVPVQPLSSVTVTQYVVDSVGVTTGL